MKEEERAQQLWADVYLTLLKSGVKGSDCGYGADYAVARFKVGWVIPAATRTGSAEVEC